MKTRRLLLAGLAAVLLAGVLTACNPPPASYAHVVVIMMENRTWTGGDSPAVGLGFNASTMPWLHNQATVNAYFSDWTETNTTQNSLTQYIGITSGKDNPNTVNDCSPSTTCRSTDDNLFRQVRLAGGTARSYVEGATTTCSASGNAAKHVPALYYYGTYTVAGVTHSDHDYCSTEVVPATQFDPNNLPTFAFYTPTLCNDGHDCSDTTADNEVERVVKSIYAGSDWQSGNTIIQVQWDEDHSVPNLTIAPTATHGEITTVGFANHPALCRTISEWLGYSPLAAVAGANSLRAATNT